MTRLAPLSLGAFLIVLAGCQPTATSVAYDPLDYDFRYAIYDDYWDGAGDINRPDRPIPPGGYGPRPEQPIYRPTTKPASARPQLTYRPPVSAGGGRVGGGGSLRGSRR